MDTHTQTNRRSHADADKQIDLQAGSINCGYCKEKDAHIGFSASSRIKKDDGLIFHKKNVVLDTFLISVYKRKRKRQT